MEVLLVYFSGTGMTRHFAGLIEQEIAARGHRCTCRELEELVDLPALWQKRPIVLDYTLRAEAGCPLSDHVFPYRAVPEVPDSNSGDPALSGVREELSRFDLVGFGSPVYEFRPAPVLTRFLLDLPRLDGGPPVFSFSTHDGAQGTFSQYMRRLLEGKGFHFVGHLGQVFLYTVTFIFRRQCDLARAGRKLAGKNAAAARSVHAFFDRMGLVAGTGSLSPVKQRPGLLPADPLIRWGYGWGLQFLLKALFFGFGLEKEECIRCLTCVRQCPQGLIELDAGGYPVRHHHCMYCLRCLNWCPTAALYFSRYTRGKARFPGPEVLLEAVRGRRQEWGGPGKAFRR